MKLQHGPYSVMINEKNTQFSEDLQNFDRIPTRVHNTAFVFYVANDDTTAAQVNYIRNNSFKHRQLFFFCSSCCFKIPKLMLLYMFFFSILIVVSCNIICIQLVLKL